jgi:hypothetical protein
MFKSINIREKNYVGAKYARDSTRFEEIDVIIKRQS